MSSPIQVVLAALSFVAGFVGTGIVRMIPGLLPDVPNQRSSHEGVIPRGGGLAIGGVTLLTWALVIFQSNSSSPEHLACLAAGALMLALGVLDDALRLSVAIRLSAQLAVMGMLCWLVLPPQLHLGGGWYLAGPWLTPLQALALVAAINFFNFMDGLDALAGSQAVFMAICLALLLSTESYDPRGLPAYSAMGLVLAAAVAGFLIWNLPPASIFMGDGGSYFLGFSLAWLALRLAVGAPLGGPDSGLAYSAADPEGPGLLTAAAVWFPFTLDPALTLLARLFSGHNPFRAHREHLYQLLFHNGWSAGTVAGLSLLASALALAAVAAGQAWGGWGQTVIPASLMALLTGLYLAARVRFTRLSGQAAAD